MPIGFLTTGQHGHYDRNIHKDLIIKYFDFLTTNLVYRPASSKLLAPKDALWHMVFDEEFRERNKLENRLKAKVAWYGPLKTFDDVLRVREFANAIAISVILRDKDDNVLVV